ncbi:restriction endonuclease subunit S [Anaerococcus sp. mt242]|uniref:restriction endonuclease subunit S n=1 Tax=Anaerococcus sp. mt242 TaxID=2661917 RepID=UPI001931F707|nr:restriction endonuclease subunit S [Anaerococcus sp. mt242]MBM0046678.1 restriction endonuclease subunit S [Anaerococcus sp. mt242]
MEFEKIGLGKVARVKNGYAYKSKDYVENGVPVVKIKNIAPPIITLEGCNFVDEEIFNQTIDYSLEYGDILISMTGSGVNQMSSAVGKVGKVNFRERALQNQRVGKIEIIDNSKYDINFLYYYISQNRLLEYFVANSTGSANQANISKKIIENTPVPNFRLSKQKKISYILSLLDKKIEINNKIIDNLEAQAKAIFKSWFVDFEPFQDENFVESELGLIPENWEITSLRKFFPVKTGKKNANIATKGGKYPFFTCSQNILFTNDYSFDENSILLAGNGDFNVKRFNGKFEAYQRTYVLTPYDDSLVSFLYNAIEYFLPQIVSGYKGSVINYITKGMIEDFKIAIPKNLDNNNNIEIFNIMDKNILKLKKENDYLVSTRDTLLPKLMSGEIDVSNIKIDDEDIDYE